MRTIKVPVSLFALFVIVQIDALSQENPKTISGIRQTSLSDRDTIFSNEKVAVLYWLPLKIPELTIYPENVGLNLLNSSRNYLEILNNQGLEEAAPNGYPGYNENVYGYGIPYSFSIRMAELSRKPLFSPDKNFYNLSVPARRQSSAHRSEFYNNPVYRVVGEVFNAAATSYFRMKDPNK
jgi:hypothetical protein